MRLYRAAHARDTITATDAYGTASFKCQLAPLELFKVQGTRIKVRQLSTAPDVTVPARGAIRINGDVFLIGHGSTDFWKGKPIRVNYVTQGADGLANLTTIAMALAEITPATAYAALVFSKYLPDANDSSRMPPQYQVFFAGTEDAPEDTLIQLASKWYLVKQSYLSTSGLRVALVNEVEEPSFETVTFGSRTYDPIADTYSSATSSTRIFRIKWSESFTYLSKASEGFERGDIQIFMLKTMAPKPSDTLALSDGTWRILSVQDEGGAWRCHGRRA